MRLPLVVVEVIVPGRVDHKAEVDDLARLGIGNQTLHQRRRRQLRLLRIVNFVTSTYSIASAPSLNRIQLDNNAKKKKKKKAHMEESGGRMGNIFAAGTSLAYFGRLSQRVHSSVLQ